MKKRGELTTQQIVMIIILIVSFLVILFFLFRLNLGETSDKEICHNSVAMKEQSKLLTGPLDCKTSYVCISGGDKCEGINPTVTVKVDLGKKDANKSIMKALANEMANCWWMFGEGKVDYSEGFNLGIITGNKICSLCSVISFDKKIQDDTTLKLSYEEFYEYLGSTEKQSGKSYLYYLYKTQDINDVKNMIIIPPEEIKFTNQYVVLTGIGQFGALQKVNNWLASGYDAFNSIFGLQKIVGQASSSDSKWFIPVTLNEKSKINDLKCEEFLTKA